MTLHPSLTVKRIVAAVKHGMTHESYPGFCIVCGRKAKQHCEPDAEQYLCLFVRCPSHSVPRADIVDGAVASNAYIHGSVYGAERLLLEVVA